MPLRDDWASAAELIRRLDKTTSCSPCVVDVLLVDGSVHACRPDDFQFRFDVLRSIRVLRLRRNLGHQRPIAIGFVQIEKALPCDAVLVMDADGEDTPDGTLKLLREFSGTVAVFAERSRHTESFVFRRLYEVYKLLHRMLTGISVRVGNFSILPSRYLGTLVIMSELWNHYAAAIFRPGLPFTMTPIPRGYRIAGTSRMNFVSLTSHGMSAISLYGEVVGVRLLIAAMAGSVLALLGILIVLGIRLFTQRAIPGWATYSIGTLSVILIQLLTIATSFTFMMLANRTNVGFLPLRDFDLFVAEFQESTTMTDFKYVGAELELFAAVRNWKSYWAGIISPFIAGDVLEVGAGIGSNTPLFASHDGRWVCLEPDSGLVENLRENLARAGRKQRYEAICGTLQTVDKAQTFDTIVYIDGLEHISNDRDELKLAASHLRPGGRIIVLAPAHQCLFTPFDAAIGHFRRYDRSMLRAISPIGLRLERLIYVDSVGLMLSGANWLFLRQSMPTKAQLSVWDKWIVPISRVLDKCLYYRIGKSIVGVWQLEKAK